MISIIITAWKEPKTVKKAIKAFIDEKIDEHYEIIVVAPDDETLNSAKEIKRSCKHLHTIKDPCRGKPTALNMAFRKAKGDLLILTDGDVYIEKGAVENLLKPFEDKTVGAVSGRPVPINSKDTMLGFWANLLTEAGAHKRRIELQEKGRFIVASGYLTAIRAGIIKEIPEETLVDDAVISHLIYGAGYKIVYAPDAIVNVKYPTTFSDWIRQKRRSAGGYNQLQYILGEKDEMRSFTKESSKITWALAYPETIKEYFWTVLLVFARLYLWLLIFVDINIKKKSLKGKPWERIESTK